MNRSYRLVWNRALRALQVASEIARPRAGGAATAGGSRLRKHPLALACAAALVLGAFALPAWSATCPGRQTAIGASTAGATLGSTGNFCVPVAVTVQGANGMAGSDSMLSGRVSGGAGGIGIEASAGASDSTLANYGIVSGGSGGNGGTGVAGGSAGDRGLFGAPGTNGGAGGVGAYINASAFILTNSGSITGGLGGAGGTGGAGGSGSEIGGQGGSGGAGSNGGFGVLGANFTLANTGNITGGAGGAGGASGVPGAGPYGNYGYGEGGSGGNGNAGVKGSGFTLTNTGTISGGAGGNGGNTAYPKRGGFGGNGAAGVSSSGNSTVITSGAIDGGKAGVEGTGFDAQITNGSQGDAVDFAGGGNTLILESGYSFGGNVVSTSGASNGGDTLALGGSTNDTFNLGQIGAEFQGFHQFAKTGSSTWTVTGADTSGDSWNVEAGNLAAAGASIAGAVNVDSGATLSGNGTLSSAVSNAGLVEASGGTLTAAQGIQGTGNITIDNGATLDLSPSTAGSSVGTLNQSGSLNLGSQNLVVSTDYSNANFGSGNSFNKNAGVTGAGQILASGNVAQAITGSDVSGGNTTNPTLAFGNVHVGGTASTIYAIANTGTSGPALRGAIQTSVNGGNLTDAALSGSGVTAGNWGPVSTGGSASYTVTYAPTTAGALTGQAVHIANNFANVGEQTMAITGTAYNYASLAFSFGSGTGTLLYNAATNSYTLSLGNISQNSGTISSVLNFLNGGPASTYTDTLSASIGSLTGTGFSLTGDSVANLAGGASQGGFGIGLSTLNAGIFNELLSFNVASVDPGSTTALGDVTLDLMGTVVSAGTSGGGNPTPVPEPGDLGMLGGGLALLGGLIVFDPRRRSHRARKEG